jgi:hypothetical protein
MKKQIWIKLCRSKFEERNVTGRAQTAAERVGADTGGNSAAQNKTTRTASH